MLRIGVLISGNGSNLQALIDYCEKNDAQIAVVISNKKEAFGLERAKKSAIPAYVVDHTDYTTREAFEEKIHVLLTEHAVDYVFLAGFMRLLSPYFVNKWWDTLVNIHPSLLPSFKGLHAPKQALEAGVKVTGCTVHFVRPEMDEGPILLQDVVFIDPQDTVETLTKKIQEVEHRIFPSTIEFLLNMQK